MVDCNYLSSWIGAPLLRYYTCKNIQKISHSLCHCAIFQPGNLIFPKFHLNSFTEWGSVFCMCGCMWWWWWDCDESFFHTISFSCLSILFSFLLTWFLLLYIHETLRFDWIDWLMKHWFWIYTFFSVCLFVYSNAYNIYFVVLCIF